MTKDILIIPSQSKILFSGSDSASIYMETQDNGDVTFVGTQGNLWGIRDTFSGSLFSVNDISGIPIFDVNSAYTSSFLGILQAPFAETTASW